jgi:molybdate transport system substrate-binding protein
MREDVGFPVEDWQVHVGVWFERHGRAVLSEGGRELLEGIDRGHSISAAAREVGVSFRHAWSRVQEINETAGAALVAASPGGSGGGGARLTPLGLLAVHLSRSLQDSLQRTASDLLSRLLTESDPAPLHVAAAVSLEEVLAALAIDYTLLQPGRRVRVVLGASDELADQIMAGARMDLFLTADASQLDRLAAEEVVRADTVLALADNTLAAIGSADLDVPVRRPRDLLGPGVTCVALAVPSCPLGSYTRPWLEGLGLYDALLPRALFVDHSRAVVAAVQAGQADAGLVYHSAAARAAGCRVLFHVQRRSAAIRYAGAVVSHAPRPEEARHFLEFLASPKAVQRFRRCGFLPVRG